MQKSTTARARISLFENLWSIQIDAWHHEEKPYLLKSVNIERVLPEIKSCSALVSVLSQKSAQAEGKDEALLIDRSGLARETSWGNFFWLDEEQKVYTPKTNILKGVTRSIVMQLCSESLPVIEMDLDFAEICSRMRGAFITSSLKGVCEIYSIDDIIFSENSHAQIAKLHNQYLQLYNFSNEHCRILESL